jgi:hypothetical protein
MEVFLIYPVFIGMGIATAELAREKGYKGRWWFLLGMLVPLISTGVLFLLKSRIRVDESEGNTTEEPTHSDKILYQKQL